MLKITNDEKYFPNYVVFGSYIHRKKNYIININHVITLSRFTQY